ncbi:MAG: Respiratory-chain dehydrogenase domain 51 kDa subunit [Sedimentibacter sp.]|nr:Respiratory-chain dehydrogenase domain 51 kDa subunit [Sedimentibacter sp.]
MLIQTHHDLSSYAKKFESSLKKQKIKVLVCCGTGCLASGSLAIYDELARLIKENGSLADVDLLKEEEGTSVKKSGCHGFCEAGPLVRIEPYNYLYLRVKLEDCEDIFNHTIMNGEPVERLMYQDEKKVYKKQEEIPFYRKQTRLVLENCGHMDAENIQECIARGGYEAFSKVLRSMEPKDVCKLVQDSGLRGRGGGGYITGKKWGQVLSQSNPVKYIVCNGDEGDPGAFMDRSMMEGDPHKIIEGMLIAGYAVGAHTGYIYVRAEYPMAVERLKRSALTASIEGERGMPRVKPPRTVEQGLFGCPTVLNNVETFANVPFIINNGSDEYKKYGTKDSPGTKAFALTGNVVNTGLIEVPMGTTLREVIFDIGGGIADGKKFKAVQIGGPSGGCLTFDERHLDLPLSFDSLKKVGAMIGSGGMVVMNEDTCMVEVARFFMSFTQRESCGKCIPCREGTKRMLEILEKIVAGNGTVEDLDLLKDIADTVKNTALCGLGKTSANPVLSTLEYFHDEYLAHVVNKVCPAKQCKDLSAIEIDASLCKGCSKCARNCPVNAISGKIKETYVIDKKVCIKCGACIEACSFKAIF